MIIRNAKVYTEDKKFQEKDVFIRNGFFSGESDDGKEIEARGCYMIPGLIDIHFHGCMGADFCDGREEAIEKIAEYEASVGVTGMVPATMTLPEEELRRILSVGADYAGKKHKGADLLGINMEGPFISKIKKGAQDSRYIIPCNKKTAEGFLEASKGLVRFIGIAPEENPGFREFIRDMKSRVNISLAHTNADYDTAMEAFQAGANHGVHLYNAMPPFSHRAPGVIGAVADSSHVYAEMICDGVHIHPSVVRASFCMLGEDRIVFISDSMRATGMADGRYTLGGLEVNVKGKRATLVSDGALAGSATNLTDCVRTAVKKMGIPLETAVGCATVNPAKCLGIYGKRGSITEGKIADAVLLDEELNLKGVIKDGCLLENER